MHTTCLIYEKTDVCSMSEIIFGADSILTNHWGIHVSFLLMHFRKVDEVDGDDLDIIFEICISV